MNTYLLNTILGHSHNIRPKPEIEIYTDQFWDVISLLRLKSDTWEKEEATGAAGR